MLTHAFLLDPDRGRSCDSNRQMRDLATYHGFRRKASLNDPAQVIGKLPFKPERSR